MTPEERAKARHQLESDEGRKEVLYRDNLGYLTIGIGRLLDPRKGGRLRPVEVDFLFDNDFEEKEAQCEAKIEGFSRLNGARKAALINMCFQMGISGLLQFRKMLAALRDEHWADARYHALDSEWAKQTPNRAQRVAYQLESGEWQ
jgi:lysozyme